MTWRYPNNAFQLFVNKLGIVIDYFPLRPDATQIAAFFDVHFSELIGKHVDDVFRRVGLPNDYGDYDYGTECFDWVLSEGTLARVWTKSRGCREFERVYQG